ncbi:hypothetical protein KBZ21_40495, partial [Streptomyces sp. A73]|nr:hypothetical protein [Streptomyces sp. A73]
SITEALVVGRYEDGEPEQFWLPFDEETKRNATHILVAGMNGSANWRTTASTSKRPRRPAPTSCCTPPWLQPDTGLTCGDTR